MNLRAEGLGRTMCTSRAAASEAHENLRQAGDAERALKGHLIE
jgi:hypothetical protein